MAFTVEKDWITEAGLRAVVIIGLRADGSKTNRCGYVAVSQDSTFFGKTYHEQLECISQDQVEGVTLGQKSFILALTACCSSDDENNLVRRSLDIVIDCHGGLTYSNGDGKYTVEEPNLWWFGFDCNHY